MTHSIGGLLAIILAILSPTDLTEVSRCRSEICDDPQEEIRDDPRETPDRGILYTAELPGNEFKVGEPILLTLRFENPTCEEVVIWHSGIWRNHRICVTDDSGDEVPRTQLGEERHELFAPGGPRDKNVPRVLKACARYVEARDLDLTASYRFDKGRYSVRVLYHDLQKPTPLRVVTEAVEFEVK